MEVPVRNYVGELQEQCQKFRFAMPNYSEEAVGGGTFKFNCKLREWVCEGTGSSKKIAKQLAAKAMIEEIERGRLIPVQDAPEVSKSPHKNSVSALFEYCAKEKQPNPLFSELPKDGDDFVWKCLLNDYFAIGKGSTKKEAKEKAASEVAHHFGILKYCEDINKCKNRMMENLSSVQELVIFCQKKSLDLPCYEVVEIKVKNVLKYKATCSVGELKLESSLAYSKKAAKCEVATLFLQTLKSCTPQASPADRSCSSQASPVHKSCSPQPSPADQEKQILGEDSDSDEPESPTDEKAQLVMKESTNTEDYVLQPLKKHKRYV